MRISNQTTNADGRILRHANLSRRERLAHEYFGRGLGNSSPRPQVFASNGELIRRQMTYDHAVKPVPVIHSDTTTA